MATSSPLQELDPLDAFALDALLATDLHVEAPPARSPSAPDALSGQAALAAFLAEMDAFDHELRDVSGCRTSFGLTPLPAAAASVVTTDKSVEKDVRSQTAPVAATTVPAMGKATHVPSLFDQVHAIQQQQQQENAEHHGHSSTKEAFSLFAQRAAIAFTLEPSRPLKRKRRIRAKEEIDTLRDTAERLARDLETLESRQKQQQQHSKNRISPVVTTSISVLTDTDKRGVAALETNRQLRKTVDAQLQFAGKVNEKLLTHISTEQQTRRLVRTAEMFEKQAPLTDADFAVFYEALTGKLDAIYSQWDKMIVARNLTSPARATFQDARVEVSDDNVATLFFSDEKLLPFDFQSVNDACWVCAKMDSLTEEGRGGITDLLPRDDDVVLVKKAFPLPLANNEEAAIPVRSVFKRFVSKSRVVFCWEGTAEWPGEVTSDPDAKSSPMRENGWGLIRPMPDNPELCHLQVCVRMKPGLSDERMLDVPAQVEPLTRLVIPAFQRMISARFQMIENLLLDKYLHVPGDRA